MAILKHEEIIHPDNQKLEVKFSELNIGDIFIFNGVKYKKSLLEQRNKKYYFGIGDDLLIFNLLDNDDIVARDLQSMKEKSIIKAGNLPNGEYFNFEYHSEYGNNIYNVFCKKIKNWSAFKRTRVTPIHVKSEKN